MTSLATAESADARRGAVGYVRVMPRRNRSELPAWGVFHITMRGVDGCPIYLDDSDRHRFMRFFRLATGRAEWRVLAYCLMTNHFHLVVLGERERISRGIHALAFRHAQAFNKRHERRGHLFQDRFHARLVSTDEHLGAACDYVLANAARIGIVDWPWRGGEYAGL
jgi:putative transposase